MSELTGAPAGARNTHRQRRQRRPRWQRVVGYLCLVVAVLLGAVLVGGIYEYYHLNGKLNRLNILGNSKETGPAPKRDVVGAQNWLIMGSDTRDCKGCAQYGRALINGGARSDTTILAHLARGGKTAALVSIPRDSWVQIPSCRLPGGSMSQPQMNKFNAAFSIGGPACTIKTVQSLTHVAIDHFVVVNFDGFKSIVDALHGVPICLRKPINDPVRIDPATGGHIGSGLVLSAGDHTLDGQQALEFVRSRYAVGDGSDLDRIKDQQTFLSSLIRKVTSMGLLLDPPELISTLNAVVKSLTVDQGVSLKSLADFGESVHGLPPSKVNLLTVPVVYSAPGMPYGDVAWNPTLAPQLWSSLQHDQPLPGTVKPHHKKGAAKLTVPPSQITVDVLNGTSRNGLAHQVAAQLQQLGYTVGQVGDAPTSTSTTYVQYGSTRVQSSQTVAAAVDQGVPRHLVSSMGDTVTLVLGDDYSNVHSVTISPSPSSSSSSSSNSLGVVNAANDRCAIG